jgi:hypothetical protein
LKVELPPIEVRLQETAIPVELGLAPAVMVALNVVDEPWVTGFGLAEPVPEGLVLPPHGASVVAVLRGIAATAVKSALLRSVSVHPAPARTSIVVVLGAGAFWAVFVPLSLQVAVVP